MKEIINEYIKSFKTGTVVVRRTLEKFETYQFDKPEEKIIATSQGVWIELATPAGDIVHFGHFPESKEVIFDTFSALTKFLDEDRDELLTEAFYQDKEWVEAYLRDIVDKVHEDEEEAERNALVVKANKAIHELTKHRIFLDGVNELKGVAADLYDTDDEKLGDRIYVAIHQLVTGDGHLEQYLYHQIKKNAEEYGITCSEEQITETMSGLIEWVKNGIADDVMAMNSSQEEMKA